MSKYADASFWLDTLDESVESLEPRASLAGDIDADVAIVGAGYTGLWTAYYLKQHAPDLRVVIVEAETAGFGASGRNGGWVAGYISGLEKYVAPLPMAQRRACCKLLFENVDAIAAALAREQIDADFHKGGVVYAAARFPEQEKRQRAVLAQLYAAGHTEDDCYWLSKRELDRTVQLRDGFGGVFKRHCATINPARMVRGLARAVERLGVPIFEQSRATAIRAGIVETAQGRVKAPIVIPALEGYASSVPGFGRYVIPVQSLIVATEPLSDALWDEIGLHTRPAFCDGSKMVSYGQRTRDGRMIFGARGGYRFGSRPRSTFRLADPEFRLREALLYDLFPMLKGVRITHGWGGSLGMARAFAPHVVFDKASGIGMAGGYGGQGVGPSHLFARTLADLVLGRETERTAMPWVFAGQAPSRVLRSWEPEPIRWLTSRAIMSTFEWEENLCRIGAATQWKKAFAMKLSDSMSLLMR
ncbi:FAD-dependent oxidoreductase [Paraburkholderia sp. Ac-20340]|uniref:NAD(P)/FAD-dependent oxidoreductase n=1 Tax=Paraburkholderia sp. Ac-20340 TaxID=2703888 RepID=UPI00198175CB|nr:FAD-binding oxidoreductase [Paraburkholderia sp. Ac-20340]MBN3851945.1 FAD-dependent oxidoreductase [Paraburkholderia sp. Ac-20340]